VVVDAPTQDVSIHAPVKGATRSNAHATPQFSSFNPRAREGRDLGWRLNCRLLEVSIHAPVKGATLVRRRWLDSGSVSIHAPVKGATFLNDALDTLICFNPRAREGRDLIRGHVQVLGLFQSTRP